MAIVNGNVLKIYNSIAITLVGTLLALLLHFYSNDRDRFFNVLDYLQKEIGTICGRVSALEEANRRQDARIDIHRKDIDTNTREINEILKHHWDSFPPHNYKEVVPRQEVVPRDLR